MRNLSILRLGLLILVVIVALIAAGVGWRLAQLGYDAPPPLVQFKRQQLEDLASLDAEIDAYADGFIERVREPSLRDSGREGVGLFIENTFFRIADGIGFKTPELSALLIPTEPPRPVTLDDPTSFVLKPLHGTIIMPPSALSALFNNYLLDYPEASLRNIDVDTKTNTLIVDGEVSNIPGIWLPFHMSGSMDVAKGHLLVYSPDTVEVASLSAGALLDLIGLELSTLLDIKTKGAEMRADSIVLDVETSLPPPRLNVRVKSMALDAQGLHLTFTSEHQPPIPTPIVESDSYIMLQGGDVKTFRTLLVGVRMQLVARDGSKLDASLYGYREQLLAGHFDATPEGGLVAYLAAPDAAGAGANVDVDSD